MQDLFGGDKLKIHDIPKVKEAEAKRQRGIG